MNSPVKAEDIFILDIKFHSGIRCNNIISPDIFIPKELKLSLYLFRYLFLYAFTRFCILSYGFNKSLIEES